MKNMKIGWRLVMLTTLAVIGFLVTIGLSLSVLRDNLMLDRQLKTKNVVETAAGILQFYYDEQQAGRLSETDAK